MGGLVQGVGGGLPRKLQKNYNLWKTSNEKLLIYEEISRHFADLGRSNHRLKNAERLLWRVRNGRQQKTKKTKPFY